MTSKQTELGLDWQLGAVQLRKQTLTSRPAGSGNHWKRRWKCRRAEGSHCLSSTDDQVRLKDKKLASSKLGFANHTMICAFSGTGCCCSALSNRNVARCCGRSSVRTLGLLADRRCGRSAIARDDCSFSAAVVP